MKTRPVRLGGDYSVSWTARPSNQFGCYHGATLQRADGEFMMEMLVNEVLDDATPKSGSTQLYGLDATNYYVDANSGCAWSFTFTPR